MLKKVSIFFVNLLIIIFIGCNIFGYNLEFDGTSNSDYVEFYNIVKSSNDSRNNRGYNSNDFVEMSKRISGNSYTIVGATIQDQPSTNYGSSGGITPIDENGYYITNKNYNVVNYDKFNGKLDDNESNLTSYFLSNEYETVKVESNNTAIKKLQVPMNAIKMSCKLYGDSNEYLITKYEIKKSFFETAAVKEIIESFKQKNGYEGVYISFTADISGYGRMETAYDFYSSIFKNSPTATRISALQSSVEELNDRLEELNDQLAADRKRLADLEEAARNGAPSSDIDPLKKKITEEEQQIINEKQEVATRRNILNSVYSELKANDTDSVWSPYVKGVYENGVYARGYTALNDYDNILRLDKLDEGKNVYVQYAKENTNGSKFLLIENAPPKQYGTDSSTMRSQYKNLIHGYTENAPDNIKYYSDIETWEERNGNSWQNIGIGRNVENVKSELIRPYEKYTFSNFSKKTFANFIRMSDEEISGKANENLSYVKVYAYTGNENESYESLWSRIQANQVTPTIDSNNEYVYSMINNNKTVIVVFVYSPESEKTIFVNFAEEADDGTLKLISRSDGTIGVAPKNNLDESLPGVKFIHGYSETGTGDLNRFDSIFSSRFQDVIEYNRNRNEYEEYKFKKISKQNYAYFIKMGIDELVSLTGNSKYEFSHTLVSAGKIGTTYEELWKDGKNVRQRQVVDDPEKLGTCVLPIDNNNTVLITFVYKTEKKKKVFVNYVEEGSDGTLSAFNVAPREKGLKNWIYISANKRSTFEEANILNISLEEDLYEEYKTEVVKRPIRELHFYYMPEDELNAKLRNLGIDENYRYSKFNKSVEGQMGEEYYELLERNSQEGTYSNGEEKSIRVENDNPTIISYIYETPSNADLELVVKHQVSSTKRILPIADSAHELLNKSEIVVSENISPEEAHYGIHVSSSDKESKIVVRETTTPKKFTISGDDKKYEFLQQYKIIGYKDGEKIELGPIYCSTNGSNVLKDRVITQTINELKKSYEKIEIIFLYKTTQTVGDVFEFNPCMYLSFSTTTGLNGTQDCENGSKGALLDESCPDNYSTTNALKTTTDAGLSAKLTLPLYYIEEMNQVISFSSELQTVTKETQQFGEEIIIKNQDCVKYKVIGTDDARKRSCRS